VTSVVLASVTKQYNLVLA